MTSTILTKRLDNVGVITLNRPAVLNAIDLALRSEMQETLEALDSADDVAVVVITGAGGNFSSGRDLKAALRAEPMFRSRGEELAAFARSSISKPVIAAVEGYALGGGFELALSCDLIVAARNAIFGLPEVTRSLVALGGGLIRLPRRLPYHAAMLIALTGDRFEAPEMHRLGVVAFLSEPGAALDAAVALGNRLAGNGQLALKATKEIVRRAFDWSSEADGFDAQMAIASPATQSEERLKSLRAFADRSKSS